MLALSRRSLSVAGNAQPIDTSVENVITAGALSCKLSDPIIFTYYFLNFSQKYNLSDQWYSNSIEEVFNLLQKNNFYYEVKSFLNGKIQGIGISFPTTLPRATRPKAFQRFCNVFKQAFSEKYYFTRDNFEAVLNELRRKTGSDFQDLDTRSMRYDDIFRHNIQLLIKDAIKKIYVQYCVDRRFEEYVLEEPYPDSSLIEAMQTLADSEPNSASESQASSAVKAVSDSEIKSPSQVASPMNETQTSTDSGSNPPPKPQVTPDSESKAKAQTILSLWPIVLGDSIVQVDSSSNPILLDGSLSHAPGF